MDIFFWVIYHNFSDFFQSQKQAFCFWKGEGTKAFSPKGTLYALWGNCELLQIISSAPWQWSGGMEAIAFVVFVKDQACKQIGNQTKVERSFLMQRGAYSEFVSDLHSQIARGLELKKKQIVFSRLLSHGNTYSMLTMFILLQKKRGGGLLMCNINCMVECGVVWITYSVHLDFSPLTLLDVFEQHCGMFMMYG